MEGTDSGSVFPRSLHTATLWFAVLLCVPQRGNGFIDCSLLMTIIQWWDGCRMPQKVFDACCLLRGDSWSLAPTSWHNSNGKVIRIGRFQIHGPIILLLHSTPFLTANRNWWQGRQTDMDSLTDTRKLELKRLMLTSVFCLDGVWM